VPGEETPNPLINGISKAYPGDLYGEKISTQFHIYGAREASHLSAAHCVGLRFIFTDPSQQYPAWSWEEITQTRSGFIAL
jgi:hypothetical protein